MARPTDWHNLDLHADPTPGDSYEIRTQARRFHNFADDVAAALTKLNSASKDSALTEANGKAMTAFRGQVGQLPGQLDKLNHSYELAARALSSYAHSMDIEQSAADGALAKARVLRGDLSRARTHLTNATTAAQNAAHAKSKLDNPTGGSHVPPPDPNQVRQAARNAQHAGSQQTAAQSHVDSLNAQLAELKTKAQHAGQHQEHAATHLKNQLHAASDAGIHNKKWYQKLADWVGENWHWVITACKVIVAIGGVLLLFVSGPILIWVVLAAALIVFAQTAVSFAQGKAGWGDLIFAALDCIPVLGKVAMVAKAGKFLGEAGTALKIVRAEKSFATVVKVWHTGEDLKGARKVAFIFAKGEGKDTLKDFMNGGWGDVKKNAASNFAGNSIGAAAGPLLDKGFSKVPGLVYKGVRLDSASPERHAFAKLSMHMNGQTAGGKMFISTSKALVTSVTKQTASAAMGNGFSVGSVAMDTAGGYGDTGVGYAPGILPAKAMFSH